MDKNAHVEHFKHNFGFGTCPTYQEMFSQILVNFDISVFSGTFRMFSAFLEWRPQRTKSKESDSSLSFAIFHNFYRQPVHSTCLRSAAPSRVVVYDIPRYVANRNAIVTL